MRSHQKFAAIMLALFAPHVAQAASDRLAINDASQVQFTVNPGNGPTYVYFRNLNDFGPG